MTRNYIDAQEGKIVYITHRIPKIKLGESSVRGIVEKGNCYKITVASDYRNDSTLYLELIQENVVLDIKEIPENEQGILEKKLAEYYKSRVDKPQKPPGLISVDLLVCMRDYQP